MTLALESSRPVTYYRRPLQSSKRMLCLALVAAIFVAAASPAAAQDPDPLPAPAPPLPAPDPAPPPAPAPARPPPAPPKPAPKPAAAPVRAPRYVAPAIATPAPQTRPLRSTPARVKRKARPKAAVTKPVEALRRLPIRDASPPPAGEQALVLAAAGFDPGGEEDDGIGAIALAAAFWLGLAAALLLIAYVTPFVVAPQPLGTFLHERRGQFALIGVNMVAAAAVCYLVVATA